MGLGSVDTWTLAEARERARQQRQLLDQGLDPIAARQTQEAAAALAKAQTVLFEQCAKDYIRDHRAGWKNAKHARNGHRRLRHGLIRSSASCPSAASLLTSS